MTIEDLLRLPPVVDLLTAATVLGIGRTTAYGLARSGCFPCRVIRIGSAYRVPTADLHRLLGLHDLTPHQPETQAPATVGPLSLVSS